MFALIAAILMIIGVIVAEVGVHSLAFWTVLGLAAWALHFAYESYPWRRP